MHICILHPNVYFYFNIKTEAILQIKQNNVKLLLTILYQDFVLNTYDPRRIKTLCEIRFPVSNQYLVWPVKQWSNLIQNSDLFQIKHKLCLVIN